jgi:hypothetical protein
VNSRRPTRFGDPERRNHRQAEAENSMNSHLLISIQPSRNIHAEHPQHEPSREHVQIVQSGIAYPFAIFAAMRRASSRMGME